MGGWGGGVGVLGVHPHIGVGGDWRILHLQGYPDLVVLSELSPYMSLLIAEVNNPQYHITE